MGLSLKHQTHESSRLNHILFNLLNMNINERIRYRMTQLGLQQTDLAKLTGASKGTVSLWVNGPSEPKGEYLLKLARGLETTPDWILNGKGDPQLHDVPQFGEITPIIVWDAPDDLDPSQNVIVPRVDVKFSAGAGHEVTMEPDAHAQGNAYRMEWIKRRGLDPKRLICVRVDGRSMEPTLPDGSVMTTDTRHNRLDMIEDGRVYAIRYGNELRVKRLSRRYDGALIIDSDNQSATFKREIVPAEDLENIGVIGRYVAHSFDGEI